MAAQATPSPCRRSSGAALDGDFHLFGVSHRFELFPGATQSESDFVEFVAATYAASANIGSGTLSVTNFVADELVTGTSNDATLTGSVTSPVSDSGAITVNSDGSLTAFGGNGQASSDGNLFALGLSDTSSTATSSTVEMELFVGVRASTGCTAANVSGTYNVSGFGSLLDASPGGAAAGMLFSPNVSKAVFISDGSGGLSIDPFSDAGAELFISNSSVDVAPESSSTTTGGSVTVADDCSVTLTADAAPSVTLTGAVTDDGRVLVLTLGDGTAGDTSGSRELLIGIRRD